MAVRTPRPRTSKLKCVLSVRLDEATFDALAVAARSHHDGEVSSLAREILEVWLQGPLAFRAACLKAPLTVVDDLQPDDTSRTGSSPRAECVRRRTTTDAENRPASREPQDSSRGSRL